MVGKCITSRPFRVLRQLASVGMAAFGGLLVLPSLVYAHGMGLDEMAPPVTTAIVVGLSCYWLIVLWPASKKKQLPALGMNVADDTIRIKQKPQLRVIERRLVDD